MSRNWDDLPPIASDDELVEWAKQLNATPAPRRVNRPNRPLIANRTSSTMSTEELLLDISDRASEVFSRTRSRTRVIVRQSALAGRTSTS